MAPSSSAQKRKGGFSFSQGYVRWLLLIAIAMVASWQVYHAGYISGMHEHDGLGGGHMPAWYEKAKKIGKKFPKGAKQFLQEKFPKGAKQFLQEKHLSSNSVALVESAKSQNKTAQREFDVLVENACKGAKEYGFDDFENCLLIVREALEKHAPPDENGSMKARLQNMTVNTTEPHAKSVDDLAERTCRNAKANGFTDYETCVPLVKNAVEKHSPFNVTEWLRSTLSFSAFNRSYFFNRTTFS
jgi:hypothetical protein